MGLNQSSANFRLKWVEIICFSFLLLFVYTSASKFLNYDRFVFQMRLAPVPGMKILAPALGWLVPSIEILIAAGFVIGILFVPAFKIKSLYASVILLVAFEIYITIMLLSGSYLPCTCGGIISQMGWKQHLFFNGFLILAGMLSISYLKKHKASPPTEQAKDDLKELSRA
jgi:putative oxidoreductase